MAEQTAAVGEAIGQGRGAMVLLESIVGLVVVLAMVEADRQARNAEFMSRFGRIVSKPMRHPPLELMEVPELCPCCGRKVKAPIGMATETTPTSSRRIIICSVCLALGPMESLIHQAAEVAASPNRTEPAQPCGPLSDPRAISDLPGGGSPAAGTF